jgi:hypothetical protein
MRFDLGRIFGGKREMIERRRRRAQIARDAGIRFPQVHDRLIARIEPIAEIAERRTRAVSKADDVAIKCPHAVEQIALAVKIDVIEPGDGHRSSCSVRPQLRCIVHLSR